MTTVKGPLDPKFTKVVALMNSTEHASERASARSRATTMASVAGMTFDQAVATINEPTTQQSVAVNPFAGSNPFSGFDDWMEEREPGYKAKHAAERAERERQRLIRRIDILERYGSKDAALAPCAKELLLRAALRPWIKYSRKPHQRWTYSVDGLGETFLWGMGDHIRKAVADAYPVPMTLAEAKAEYEYWRVRRQEMQDVLGEYGDTGLDRPAQYRMDLVDDIVRHDLPLTTLADITARLAAYIDFQRYPDKAVEAVHRDLSAIVSAGATPIQGPDLGFAYDPSASNYDITTPPEDPGAAAGDAPLPPPPPASVSAKIQEGA